jgi:hypothetical protein
MTRAGLVLALVLVLADQAAAAVRVRPTGVNVSSQGPTTVFLTFAGLREQSAVDALWCGELIQADPDLGLKCDPATIFGSLPARFDRSRVNGTGSLTDVMSIPASVVRRAYQAARTGTASFFYVRRFVSTAGGPDEYVAVTCRLTAGGALSPLSLVDVRLSFADGSAVRPLAAGEPLPPFEAHIRYTGTGRLLGRWEVVVPGDEPPTSEDLLTEATLPNDMRGQQRRYAEIRRFSAFLPPTGRITLPGPAPGLLPTRAAGDYLILLRVEASDDRESDASAIGPGPDIVHTGAVAGFPTPVLRYVVPGHAEPIAQQLKLVHPLDGMVVSSKAPLDFTWQDIRQAAVYRVEIGDSLEGMFSGLVPSGRRSYRAPPWIGDRLAGRPLRWRVVALDTNGTEIESSNWRTLNVRAAQ